MSRKIRILFVIPTLDVGGAEMDLVHNAPRLDPALFDVTVCTLLRRGPLEPMLMLPGITIVGPFLPTQATTKVWPRRLTKLRRVLRPIRSAVTAAGGALARIWSMGWRWLGTRPLHLSPYTTFKRRFRHFVIGLLPSHWLMFFRLARPLARYIRLAEIDVVHTILPNSYLVGGMACVMTGRQLVMSRLSLNWYQKTQPIYRFLEGWLMHRFVRVAVGNSRQIIDELGKEGIAAHRLKLVYNGIPIPQFRIAMGDRATTRAVFGLAPDCFVMTTIGTLWPYKGHADLLDALAIAGLPDNWVLLLAGRDIDSQLARLEEQSIRLDLRKHIRFLGERGDVPALLGAADLHVTASHTEGVPNNVLEAMCAGLAVVATDVGGIPELVIDGETGLLVPSRNPAALAAAVTALAVNAPLRAKMGAAAQRRVAESFSIEASVASLQAIYLGLGVLESGVADR